MAFSSTIRGLILLVALSAPPAAAAEQKPFSIGYLEIADDARYVERRRYTGIRLKTRHRPFPGAEISIRDSRIAGRALGLKFGLERAAGKDANELAALARGLREASDIRFFVVDAPAGILTELADATADDGILLFNVSEPATALRAADCRANLMHVLPSRAMLTDALVQYLAARRWRDVLVLRGPLPEDSAQAAAFEASARKFGVRIVASKDFVLGNDPRQRDRNNIALLTSAPDHDVVFLADSDGEFGRYVPYQTAKPRPVVGAEGLVASAWHWTWERHGAPQLNQRFERKVGRDMADSDWAAWVAVKAVVEAISRTRATDFASIAGYIKGDRLTLDAYKGAPASFRPWNNQLRQPILLHTHNAVAGRAPLPGFLHPTENMDTLGIDKAESKCRF